MEIILYQQLSSEYPI